MILLTTSTLWIKTTVAEVIKNDNLLRYYAYCRDNTTYTEVDQVPYSGGIKMKIQPKDFMLNPMLFLGCPNLILSLFKILVRPYTYSTENLFLKYELHILNKLDFRNYSFSKCYLTFKSYSDFCTFQRGLIFFPLKIRNLKLDA